jgi:hypothetical protein
MGEGNGHYSTTLPPRRYYPSLALVSGIFGRANTTMKLAANYLLVACRCHAPFRERHAKIPPSRLGIAFLRRGAHPRKSAPAMTFVTGHPDHTVQPTLSCELFLVS